MPPAPVTLNFTCVCAPEAVDGACPAGQVLLNYKQNQFDADEAPYQQCVDSFAFDPVSSAYSVSFCWRTACLPSKFAEDAFSVFISDATFPDAEPLAAGAVSVVLMKPQCSILSASGRPAEDPSATINFCSNCVTELPTGGLQDLSLTAYVPVGCNDKYASALLLQLGSGAPPEPLESHCPCWEIPSSKGVCSGIKVPITLSTTEEDAGVSFRQCIDPANYAADPATNFTTGQMAFSYCWRYACLPDAFAHSDFTATVTKLAAFHIREMPSGPWNTSFKHTPGVGIVVTADPQPLNDLSQPPSFNFSDDGIVIIPENGLYDMTFEFFIPVGFDDLSASVQMYGPPPPAPPPKRSSCDCNDKPFLVDGVLTCLDYQTLVYVDRTDGGANTVECITLANYDVHIKRFAFSQCWRYSCLPDAFSAHPYTLSVYGMTRYNIPQIPVGDAVFVWQRPVLSTFSMNMTAHFANGQQITVTGSQNDQRTVVTIPTGGIESLDIVYYIPFDMRVDDNSAAISINPLGGPPLPPVPPVLPPAPPSPPAPPPRPPLPPGIGAFQQGVVVTAFYYVLSDVTDAASLQSLMQHYAADLRANISSFTTTLPITFPDFGIVSNCTPAATKAFYTNLGTLVGINPDNITCTCSLGGDTTSSRRKLHVSSDAITVYVTLTTESDPNAVANAVDSAVSSPDFNAVTGTPSYGSNIVVSRTVASATDPAEVQSSQCDTINNAVTSALGTESTTLGSCVATRNMVQASTSDGTATPPGAGQSAPSAPPPPGGGSSSSDSGSSFPVAAVIAGCVGGVVGLALLAGGAMYYRKRKAAAQNENPATVSRFKSYTDERGAAPPVLVVGAAAGGAGRDPRVGSFDDLQSPGGTTTWGARSPTGGNNTRQSAGLQTDVHHDEVMAFGAANASRGGAPTSPTAGGEDKEHERLSPSPMPRPAGVVGSAWSSFTAGNSPMAQQARPSSAGRAADGSAPAGDARRSRVSDNTGTAPSATSRFTPTRAASEAGSRGGSRSGIRASPNMVAPLVLPLDAGDGSMPVNRQSSGGALNPAGRTSLIARSPSGVRQSPDDLTLPVPPRRASPPTTSSGSVGGGAAGASYFRRAPVSGGSSPTDSPSAATTASNEKPTALSYFGRNQAPSALNNVPDLSDSGAASPVGSPARAILPVGSTSYFARPKPASDAPGADDAVLKL